MENCYKREKTSRLFTAVTILIPVLRLYRSGIPGIDLAEALLLVAFAVGVFLRGSLSLSSAGRKILFLVPAFLFITIFDMFIYEHSILDILVLFIRWTFYLVVLVFGCSFFDFSFAKRFLMIVSVIVCFGLILQMISYYGFSKIVPLRIPFLSVNDSMSEAGTFVTLTYDFRTFRASSFFSEPAHFAYFVCISLMVSLMFGKHKYLLSSFFTLCILLSTSTGGIIMAAIIWMYYLFIKEKRQRTRKFVIVLSLVVAIAILSLTTPLFNYFNSKILLLFESGGSSSSRTNFIEQLSGFSFANLITGIGFGNAEYYITSVLNKDYTYVSSISLILMWTGLLGFLYLTSVFWSLFKKSNADNRIFVVIFVVSLFGTGMITSSYLILFLIWPLSSLTREKATSHCQTLVNSSGKGALLNYV